MPCPSYVPTAPGGDVLLLGVMDPCGSRTMSAVEAIVGTADGREDCDGGGGGRGVKKTAQMEAGGAGEGRARAGGKRGVQTPR